MPWFSLKTLFCLISIKKCVDVECDLIIALWYTSETDVWSKKNQSCLVAHINTAFSNLFLDWYWLKIWNCILFDEKKKSGISGIWTWGLSHLNRESYHWNQTVLGVYQIVEYYFNSPLLFFNKNPYRLSFFSPACQRTGFNEDQIAQLYDV